jgi:hypothetical protein
MLAILELVFIGLVITAVVSVALPIIVDGSRARQHRKLKEAEARNLDAAARLEAARLDRTTRAVEKQITYENSHE